MYTNNQNAEQDTASFEELEAMFGSHDNELEEMEKVSLTQNLEGFASCFPAWDLHPPVLNAKK